MNRIKYLLAAIALVVMAGCGKKVDVAFTNSSVAIAPEGESVEVALTSNGDWTVNTYPEWLTVSPTSGKGDATLKLTAPLNESGADRSGEVKVSSKDNTATLTVTQGMMEADYIRISPELIECEAEGGTFTLTVASNCDWAVNTSANWVSCEPASGTGDGTVTVTVAPIEGDMDDRETNLFFSGLGSELLPVSVVQHAEVHVYIRVDPSSLMFEYESGSQNVAIACAGSWTATVENDWISIDVASGNGNTVVAVTVTENELALEAREGRVNFVSETQDAVTLIVKQEGAPDPHHLVVTPATVSFDKNGGSVEFSVSCDVNWTASTEVSWLSLETLSGTGDGTVTLTAEPNTVNEARTAQVVFVSAGLRQNIAVTQAAGEIPPVVTVTPDTLYASYTGGFVHITISANTSWSVETAEAWLDPQTVSGEGNAQVAVVVDLNNSDTERVGVINIKHGSQTMCRVVVVQEGRPTIFETDITEINARPEGGEYTVHITANQTWNIETSVDWLVCIPSSGSGNGEFMVKINPLPSARPRETELRIYGGYGSYLVIPVSQSN